MSKDLKYYYYYYGASERKPTLNAQNSQMQQLRAWLGNNRDLIRGQWSPFAVHSPEELIPVNPHEVTGGTLTDSDSESDFDESDFDESDFDESDFDD